MNSIQPSIKNKRALAYVRISSLRQVNGESPETQKAAIARYAESENIEIIDIYYDEAKSGKNTDRVELQNMLDYASKNRGEIDYVIVYKMNRASRDMESYIMGFRVKLKALGVSIRSATEPIDDTPLGQFMEYFSILVGQMDNQTKQGFTVDNMKSLAYQGYWQHPPILGYENYRILNDAGKHRPTLKLDSKAPLVKDVLERFSQGNITKAELTRYAASIGLRSRYGKKLSEDSIHRMLKHPVYAGYVADNLTSWELVQGKHDAIISKEIYELNQTLLYGKRKRAGEVRQLFNPDYPLKGLVLCPNCMKPLYASAPKTGAGGKSPRYHCSRKACKGLYKSIKASVMHDDFEELLTRVRPDERILALYKEVLLAESMNQLGSLNTKLAKLRTKLSTISDSRLAAIRKFNNDQLSYEEKEDLIKELDNDKQVITKDVKDLESQQTIREADIDLAIAVMDKVDQQWLVASPQSKQRFQSMIFPEGLVYDYELGRFGTSRISPFYTVIATKKDSEEPSKSFLVAGAGFEPATLWL